MAFTKFNIISTGADTNSGSTTANGAVYTSTSGNWSTVTNQFTPTDGSTPASSINVGDWVSIYVNASAATSYVAQVTAVAAGVNGAITVSSTIDYGTPPTTATGTMSLKAGGAWASFTPIANFGTATVPVSTEIDIKLATYTLSAGLTIALKGTALLPLWYRGYVTSVGDLDSPPSPASSTSYPTISAGTNLVTLSGALDQWSGLSFTSSRSGAGAQVTTTNNHKFFFCRFANSAANASATAMTTTSAGGGTFEHCYFSSSATATSIVTISSTSGNDSFFTDCWFAGANSGTTQVGALISSTNSALFTRCTFYQPGSHAISQTSTGRVTVDSCTFYQPLGDGIHYSGVPGTSSRVRNCYFYQCGGFDINNATGSTIGNVALAYNVSNQPTSGHLNGFGDWNEFGALSEAINPFVSSTDLHLTSSSVGAGAGLPQQWENQTSGLNSTLDVGAWQRAVSGGAAGILVAPGWSGGFNG